MVVVIILGLSNKTESVVMYVTGNRLFPHAYCCLTQNDLLMARLDYDIDNFSGRNGRGTRYDIKVDGIVVYHDVAEECVDGLCEEMERKPWLYDNIEVIELNY